MINGESRNDSNSHNNNGIEYWVMNMVRHHIFSLSPILLPVHPWTAVAILRACVVGKKILVLGGKKEEFFLKGKNNNKRNPHSLHWQLVTGTTVSHFSCTKILYTYNLVPFYFRFWAHEPMLICTAKQRGSKTIRQKIVSGKRSLVASS